jgi:1,4-alpha-glucan branching enzyme
MSGTSFAQAGTRSDACFEQIGGKVVSMLMMKATNKTKKSLVGVKAVAPEAAKSVPVRPAEPAGAQPAPARSRSPQPARVSLELVEPAAQQVYVAGSFNGWKPDTTPLMALGNGRWKGDIRLGPGRYEYLFVVDGQWRLDPNARETVQNPFGGQNSVVMVSE